MKHHIFFGTPFKISVEPAIFILKAILLLLLFTGCNYSCSLQEYELTTTGYAAEPHIVYNGSNYGIVYYWAAQSGSWPEIRMLTVDDNGVILKSKTGLGSLVSLYVPTYISDLVWNNTNRQFAFAYTKGKVLNFIRLDENLNVLGNPLEIKFPGVDANSNEHPILKYSSLVWNNVLNEYGLTFITVEYPFLPDRHDDIYISRINSSGNFIGEYEKTHIVTCPGDGEFTSLTYDTTSGRYAVSYIKHELPLHRVMIGFLTLPSSVAEHEVMSTWKPDVWPNGVRVLYDPGKKNYLVVAQKLEICSQIVDGNGNPVGNYSVKANRTYAPYFSVDYMSGHTYFICAQTPVNSIGGWMTTASGHANDILSINPGAQPSAANMHFAWIRASHLFFGKYKITAQ